MAQQEIFKNDQDKVVEFKSLKDLLQRNLNEIENISLGNVSAGISTSFYDFDAMTQGLRRRRSSTTATCTRSAARARTAPAA